MPHKHLALSVLFFAAFAHSSDNTITYGGKVYKTVLSPYASNQKNSSESVNS